ncbi:MAG: tetratricopeptide repeat protein [Candidatus Omnitrophota bacterium]
MSHKFNHTCGCTEKHWDNANKACEILPRWLFCILFILCSFYLFKPVIVRQLTNRAVTYISYPLYDEAVREYKKAIFLDKSNSSLYTGIAYVYRSKNDIEKAQETYHEAIRLDPGNKAAIFELGMLYFKEANFLEAAKYFNIISDLGEDDKKQTALGIVSYHHSALRMLVECYSGLNQKEKEQTALQKLFSLYPKDRKREY